MDNNIGFTHEQIDALAKALNTVAERVNAFDHSVHRVMVRTGFIYRYPPIPVQKHTGRKRSRREMHDINRTRPLYAVRLPVITRVSDKTNE